MNPPSRLHTARGFFRGGGKGFAMGWGAVALLLVPLLISNAQQRSAQEWRQRLDAMIQEHVGTDWRLPEKAEIRRFLVGAENALETGSVSELAWLYPHLKQIHRAMKEYPELDPLRKWMTPRLVYFRAAYHFQQRQKSAPRQTANEPRPNDVAYWTNRVPAVATSASTSTNHTETAPTSSSVEEVPEHAQAYVPMAREVFSQAGVPTELIWLAEVESSWNPEARSPVGAVGLFQFMPATAQRFGLSINPNDERKNPRKSATAAAKYLRILYRTFDSWPLALAAYNAGEGRVQQTLDDHPGSKFHQISSALPAETQMYVPRVLATIEKRTRTASHRIPPPKS